jgi:polysaccharide biosynthesis/export protein
MRTILTILVTLACALAFGQAQTSDSLCDVSEGGATSSAFFERDPRYRIQSGDSFDVTFQFIPEFNQTSTVQPDGFVTLREIGDVKVAGQTVPKLTTTLCKAYSKIMVTPSISIILKDFNKPSFVASGQVVRPGRYDLRGETTLTEAIAMAGGLTEKSKHSQILLFRKISDKWSEALLIDVKKMVNSKNLREDPILQAGDMIVVPQNWISKISRYLPTPSLSMYLNPSQF